MESLDRPLRAVRKKIEGDITEIIASKRKLLESIQPEYIGLEKESSAEAAWRNAIRKEMNEKLKVQADFINHGVLPHVRMLTDKVLVVFTQLQAVVMMAVVISVVVCGIFGAVIALIQILKGG